jgi:hypothetical protein
MTPTRISGHTHTFSAPDGWDESAHGPCIDLSVRKDGETYQSTWRPTPEELATLNDGGVVVLCVAGSQPPCWLSVS